MITKVDLVELFPASLFSYLWEASDSLNEQLRSVIIDQERASVGIVTSNAGGWHSEKDLQEWDHECIKIVLDRIIMLALQSVPLTLGFAHCPEEIRTGWIIQAWANVNRCGNFNKYHHHIRNLNLWSGVYYVDIGNDQLGGQIVFADQHRPGFKEQPGLSARYAVRPRSGLMLLFPSSLGHRVEAYHGTAERITIAFNLRHEGLTTLNYEIEKKQAAKKAQESKV